VNPEVRVYLPATLTGLPTLSDVGLTPGPAFAVTDRLRVASAPPGPGAEDPHDLADELAEAALLAAADAGLEILAADPSAPPRRVVVAADLPVRAVPGEAGAHPAAVECDRPVRRADVASVLVDDVAAGPAVAAAVAALRAGDAAAFEAARDELDGHALSWYDASELEVLAADAPPAHPGGPSGDPSPTRDRTEGSHP
jgi:hypothetical protein